MSKNWLQLVTPPALHDRTPIADRHATWLELFFDLVFVVAIAELGHLLADSLTIDGITEFVGLFVPVWWVWSTHSYYGDVFDQDDVVFPIASIVVMLGVIIWSFTFPAALYGGAVAFILVYVFLRLVNIGLYLIASRTVPEARELATKSSIGNAIGLSFWIVSLAVSPPLQYGLWAVGLIIEISWTPVVYMLLEDVPIQRSHMDERFGLFTIVVLGESILGVASGTTDTNWQATAAIIAVAGFLIAVCFWWLYFAYSDSNIVNRFIRSDWIGAIRGSLYVYGHLPVFACITAFGIGIETTIVAGAEGHEFVGASQLILFGSTAGFLVTVTIIQWAGLHALPRSTIVTRFVGASIILVLATVSSHLGVLLTMLLLAGTFIVLVAIEIPRIGSTRGIEQSI
ncbi:low temperature requirement protein A [Haladaptatus sp. AB618]|uniref:low temperature requirement protein A n=1 Tax=Haladaptatus sp. AB618 TaxID=2934173 RepID=UPI00209C4B03|nr:low temperature requirement protein A [Haladaptatus sp. AB618]MCO8255807.1 low temperature requirement protein A [Haladaptatus sp. AB618]